MFNEVLHSSNTGKKTFLSETSLKTFPDYVKTPSQKAREEVPDGTAFPAEVAGEDQQEATSSASTTTTTKGK